MTEAIRELLRRVFVLLISRQSADGPPSDYDEVADELAEEIRETLTKETQ